MAAIGLTTVPSDFGPKETMDRLEADQAIGIDLRARRIASVCTGARHHALLGARDRGAGPFLCCSAEAGRSQCTTAYLIQPTETKPRAFDSIRSAERWRSSRQSCKRRRSDQCRDQWLSTSTDRQPKSLSTTLTCRCSMHYATILVCTVRDLVVVSASAGPARCTSMGTRCARALPRYPLSATVMWLLWKGSVRPRNLIRCNRPSSMSRRCNVGIASTA
jgi:hypothetical protein